MPPKRKTASSASAIKAPKRTKRRDAKEEEDEESLRLRLEEEAEENSVDEQGVKIIAATADSRGKNAPGNGSAAKTNSRAAKSTVQLNDRRSDRRDAAADDDDKGEDGPEPRFVGDPVPEEEARLRWRYRYTNQKGKQIASKSSEESEEKVPAKRHYKMAEVDGIVYNVGDDAHVQAGEGEECFVCRIVEMFEGVDGALYFTAQWYYRGVDTVIKNVYQLDERRVFFSEIRNDNPLDCLVEKLDIARVPLNVDLEAKMAAIPSSCHYYCDTKYLLPYSTFVNLPIESKSGGSESSSTISSDLVDNGMKYEPNRLIAGRSGCQSEARLLDLYSGCGAMSTGLCLGANLSGLNLVTRWAVDLNKYACESLQMNHPETEVRNESAEDFLLLLKEWEKLCIRFSLVTNSDPKKQQSFPFDMEDQGTAETDEEEEGDSGDEEIFEVEKILQICYGDPKEKKEEHGLYFKVRWKGYGSEHDSWEPVEGLGNCCEAIKKFVIEGFNSKILPLPGDADVICGGPPCQGISGFNRFRKKDNPLGDEKNKQLIVYMDIVDHLKPKFVLMENVVDILKFANGFLGRYALGRLLEMNYQARLGMMAAGAYGLPQFRMRVFLWGARPTESLPQYPLPTHDVIMRGVVPVEFESNVVAYDEGYQVELEKKLFLADAISDLPSIENFEERDEMEYDKDPETEFQRLIRMTKEDVLGSKLFDHRPLKLNDDDYQRVCQIPKRKGANFRHLPGVCVRPDNKVEWDPNVKRVYLPSGKPLVPNYAMTFVDGTSSKPFARLWWDETVPTVVTRAEPHNQAILHPEQDRVLSIRENARLQGFPDYYKLSGPIKERYIQVGNAVAVPVARALGFSLGLAFQGSTGTEPLVSLPGRIFKMSEQVSSESSEDNS